MPRLRDPLPGRAMVPGLLTTLPTPGRWWCLPMLRGDDHRRRAHRRHRREPTLARDQHTRPSLKKPPRFEGKLISSLVDTWLEVVMLEAFGERNRGLYVLKSRGMGHSNQIREFLLSDSGVSLVPVVVGAGGVLTGSGRVAV